jgi:hypothetical protein
VTLVEANSDSRGSHGNSRGERKFQELQWRAADTLLRPNPDDVTQISLPKKIISKDLFSSPNGFFLFPFGSERVVIKLQLAALPCH